MSCCHALGGQGQEVDPDRLTAYKLNLFTFENLLCLFRQTSAYRLLRTRIRKLKLQSNANYDIRFLLVRLLVDLSYFPLFIPRYKIYFILLTNRYIPASLPVLVFTYQIIFLTPITFATPIDIKTAPKENSAPILAAS